MDRTKNPTTRRAIGRRAALPALLGLIMTACAAGRGPEPPEGTGAPPATPHEAPAEAELGDPIALDELPALPGEGVAVQMVEGLVFVDLDGNVHGHVPEATLQYMRGLQHVPAGLVPVAGEEYGAGWLEPSTGELWPGYWGAPLLGDASAQLDPHAGSPDAYVIHRPDAPVAQWGRDDRWWLSAGHRTVTWEQCAEGAVEPAACPMQGHDLDMGGDLQIGLGCWVSDTLGDFTQLRVCTDFESEPRSWLELGSTGQQLDRYELPRPADMPDDTTTTGHFLSAELADGWILAGASMECEANKAALIDVDTGELQPILEEDEPLTLGATALGWTGDGRAAVLVDEQPCADNGVPGVWLIDPAASEAELIYALPEGASAEGHLWRPVPGIDLAARASGGVADNESGE